VDALSLHPDLKEQVDPYLADAYMLSAKNRLKTEEYEDSVKRFQKMVEIDFRRLEPNIADIVAAYKGWAKSKVNEKEIDEIFSSFDVLAKLSPNNMSIIMGTGEIAFAVGRYAKALECFNKAKDIDVSVAPQANNFIGQIYLSRAQNYM
jgi:tetratricopeptide (TPR) repeat protein